MRLLSFLAFQSRLSNRLTDATLRYAVLGLTPSYEILEPTGFTAWDALCPPNSTARRTALALPVDTPRGVNLQSFVSIEHAQTMDLCEHPDLRAIHGFTASWCVSFFPSCSSPRTNPAARAGPDPVPTSFTPSSPSRRLPSTPTSSFPCFRTTTTSRSGVTQHGRRRSTTRSCGGVTRRGAIMRGGRGGDRGRGRGWWLVRSALSLSRFFLSSFSC